MTFLETLVRMFDGCAGLLEVMTVFFDVSAIYLGVRTYQRQRHAAEKAAHHAKTLTKRPAWWPVAVLGAIGIVLTALTVFKYLHGVR